MMWNGCCIQSLLFLVTEHNTVSELDRKLELSLQIWRFRKVYADEEGVVREFSCINQSYCSS